MSYPLHGVLGKTNFEKCLNFDNFDIHIFSKFNGNSNCIFKHFYNFLLEMNRLCDKDTGWF